MVSSPTKMLLCRCSVTSLMVLATYAGSAVVRTFFKQALEQWTHAIIPKDVIVALPSMPS